MGIEGRHLCVKLPPLQRFRFILSPLNLDPKSVVIRPMQPHAHVQSARHMGYYGRVYKSLRKTYRIETQQELSIPSVLTYEYYSM